MDLTQMIADLRFELKQIDSAIVSLERLKLSRGDRRGRPSRWTREAMAGIPLPSGAKKRRRPSVKADQ